MTNRELNLEMAKQVLIERKAGKEILRLLVLARKQHLCGELGYKDLADWLIRGHKMSERSAYRKLRAAKFSSDVPEVLEKIERGCISLTAVSQVQTAIEGHEKFTGEKLSPQEKIEVIKKVEGLKIHETERKLISLFPEIASEVKRDRTTVINENISRIAINLPNETLEMIQRAKELLSHTIPSSNQSDVITYVFTEFLSRRDPLRKPTQSAGKWQSQAAIKRLTIQNAKGACEFIDHETGVICGSTHQLQIDHIKPKAIGGSDDPSNLRCLCRRHNLYMAEINLGVRAAAWKKSLS